jgi:hypothetical protein
VEQADGRLARLSVLLDGGEQSRAAISYPQLTGEVEPGDDVIVNVAAQELGLGSGGFDIVHANLSRGLGGSDGEAHVMKLNYTSIQHPVRPLEEGLECAPAQPSPPAAVLALHGQLPCVAFALRQLAPDVRVGYVQTPGGALTGWLSETVADLFERGMLVDHVTAAAAHGGGLEAVTVEGALDAGARSRGWDCAILGPGPGILGSASALGHGGLAALANAHAAMALGAAAVVLVPRLSSGDPRGRHRHVSHHTRTVLELLLRGVTVPVAEGLSSETRDALERAVSAPDAGHVAARVDATGLLEEYRASGLPATTMGRSLDQDRDFFLAGLAGGAVLAEHASRWRESNGV